MPGTSANAVYLGHHLGSRDPQHISRWAQALTAGRRAAPKCEGDTASGAPCQSCRCEGARHCRHHLHQGRAEDRERAEKRLEKRHADVLKFGGTAIQVHRAHAGLRRLARLRLHRRWKHDPRVEGSTIAFADEADQVRVRRWLVSNCGVDIAAPVVACSDVQAHMSSPRALDRCLWAGWRIVRSNVGLTDQFIENAKLRVKAAVRDDARFWASWAALGEPNETNAAE